MCLRVCVRVCACVHVCVRVCVCVLRVCMVYEGREWAFEMVLLGF